MAIYTPQIPKRITANDTITWTDSFTTTEDDSVFYVLVSRSDIGSATIYGTPDSSRTTLTYFLSLPNAGGYRYQVKIDTQGNILTLANGELIVEPDLSAIDTIELSNAEKMLSVVEEAISTLISGGVVKRYQIGTRELEKYSLEELIGLRSKLRLEVSQQRKAAQGIDSRIHIRFARP